MLSESELKLADRASASKFGVEIASVATAVPKHKVGQDEVSERAQKVFPQFARLDAL